MTISKSGMPPSDGLVKLGAASSVCDDRLCKHGEEGALADPSICSVCVDDRHRLIEIGKAMGREEMKRAIIRDGLRNIARIRDDDPQLCEALRHYFAIMARTPADIIISKGEPCKTKTTNVLI